MPNVKDKIRNWTRKFAVNGIALKPFVILLSVNCITAEVHGEDREARNVEQAERAEQAADWSAQRVRPQDFRALLAVAVFIIGATRRYEAWSNLSFGDRIGDARVGAGGDGNGTRISRGSQRTRFGRQTRSRPMNVARSVVQSLDRCACWSSLLLMMGNDTLQRFKLNSSKPYRAFHILQPPHCCSTRWRTMRF